MYNTFLAGAISGVILSFFLRFLKEFKSFSKSSKPSPYYDDWIEPDREGIKKLSTNMFSRKNEKEVESERMMQTAVYFTKKDGINYYLFDCDFNDSIEEVLRPISDGIFDSNIKKLGFYPTNLYALIDGTELKLPSNWLSVLQYRIKNN